MALEKQKTIALIKNPDARLHECYLSLRAVTRLRRRVHTHAGDEFSSWIHSDATRLHRGRNHWRTRIIYHSAIRCDAQPYLFVPTAERKLTILMRSHTPKIAALCCASTSRSHSWCVNLQQELRSCSASWHHKFPQLLLHTRAHHGLVRWLRFHFSLLKSLRLIATCRITFQDHGVDVLDRSGSKHSRVGNGCLRSSRSISCVGVSDAISASQKKGLPTPHSSSS